MEQTWKKGRSASHKFICLLERGRKGLSLYCPGNSSAVGSLPPSPPHSSSGKENWIRNQKVPNLFSVLPQGSCVALGKLLRLPESLFAHLLIKKKKSLLFLLTESWSIYSRKSQNKINPLLRVLYCLMNWSPSSCSVKKIQVARISHCSHWEI